MITFDYPFSAFATILLETKKASPIDQRYSRNHRITVKSNGNCIKNQPFAFSCCRLKCCPKKRKGIRDRIIVNNGLKVPHGPTPPFSSLQITPITPNLLIVSASSSSEILTTSSSAIPVLIITE